MTLTAEQLFLLEQARHVWRERASAKAAKLPWQEETITDILLKNVKLGYPGVVEVIPFTKPLEGESGADWLWSFESADRSTSTTMLIQAKRLADDEIDYPDLDRTVGRRLPPVRQIDQLINTADEHGVPALYAFYNHLTDVGRIPITCRSLAPGSSDHALGFGISIADAAQVRAAISDKRFEVHAAHSIPFHCLLCSGGLGGREPGGSPAAIIRTLRRQLRARRAAARADAAARREQTLGFELGTHPLVARAREVSGSLIEGVSPTELNLPEIAGVVSLTDEAPN